MPNEYGKSIDKTYLSIDNAEERGFLHRDYIAHCLRWSHVVKFMQEKHRFKEAMILDIGCGKEAPLLKTLYTSRLLPAFYWGVDYGKIEILDNILALTKYCPERIWLSETTNFMDVNFTTIVNDLKARHIDYFNTIVMFEVLEHVEKEAGIQLLEHIQEFMCKDTVFFMSTPCYDGANKAANHVYEWGYRELKEQLLSMDFKIRNHWGTFASLKDYVNEPEFDGLSLRKAFDLLRSYYDVNLLSVIFAPMIPQFSRNCLWELSL
jgi:hypothetical protein